MSTAENEVPTPEFVASFEISVFHTMGDRFEAQITDVGRFRGYDLASCLAGSLQAMLFSLHERQKHFERLQPGQPV